MICVAFFRGGGRETRWWSTLPVLLCFFVLLNFLHVSEGLFAYSNCHRNTRWQKGHGAPIKSFLKSIVQASRPNPVNPRLTAAFNNNRRLANSIAVGYQYMVRGWKKFGTKEFDGWLYGEFDNIRDMTGVNLTFVYDDYRTVLLGTWDNGDMVEARKARIKAFRCMDGILELQTTDVHEGQQTFTYEPTGVKFITSYPTVMDPFDQNTIFIRNSNIPVVVGDGIFARRDIPLGSLVAYYAGAHLYDYNSIIFPNMTLDEREERHKNLLSFNDDYDLDCADANILTYRAALGHKANHAFDANTKFCFVKSPRFGETRCLEATKDISKGDEIYVDYRYNLDSSYVPRWYKTLYYQTYPEERTTTASAQNDPRMTTTSLLLPNNNNNVSGEGEEVVVR